MFVQPFHSMLWTMMSSSKCVKPLDSLALGMSLLLNMSFVRSCKSEEHARTKSLLDERDEQKKKLDYTIMIDA